MRQIKTKTIVFLPPGVCPSECRSAQLRSDSNRLWADRPPYSLVDGSPRGENADFTVGRRLLSFRGDTLTTVSPPVRLSRNRVPDSAAPPQRFSFEEILHRVLQTESGEIA